FVVQRARVIVGRVECPILRVELNIATDKEVDTSVAIVVEPRGTDRPALDVDSRCFGDVLECSISAIAIQHRLAITGDKKIYEAIIVIVGSRDGDAVHIRGNTG